MKKHEALSTSKEWAGKELLFNLRARSTICVVLCVCVHMPKLTMPIMFG